MLDPEKVKGLRVAAGFETQDELIARSYLEAGGDRKKRITRATLSRAETGCSVTFKTACLLADLLKVDVGELRYKPSAEVA